MIRYAKKRYPTPPGSPIRITYELRISTQTGQPELYEKGKENFQDYIQSFAESCDLGVIIRRINAGEIDLLNARPGSYGDFSLAPENIQSAMNTKIDALNIWDNMSDEQKTKFGSFEDFCVTAGTDEWFMNLGVIEKDGEVNADNEQ